MIHAFRQLRLTNAIVSVTGAANDRLQVGSRQVVYTDETGNFGAAGGGGGVSSLSITGLTFSGAVALTGLGSTVVTKSGQTVYFNTDLTPYALSSNTGSFVTTSQTGAFADAGNLALTGNTFAVWTGKFQSFNSGITPTGLDSYFIGFPLNFSAIPRVVASLVITGNTLYSIAIQTKSTSGYYCLFSDLVAESGISIDTIATLN